METEFQFQLQPLSDGDASSTVDAAYMSGLCAGLTFRSLLTHNDAVSAMAPPSNFYSEAAMLPDLLSLEPPSLYTPAANATLPINQTASYKRPARRRRSEQKISQKTRCLQKLLPRDEKMDMATTLEEAYKYIQFLQAQISVLRSMPSDGGVALSGSGGDLGRLNRQQLLQVVVNSPVAQAQLYTKGCCVYSMEQLLLLNNEKRSFPSNLAPF